MGTNKLEPDTCPTRELGFNGRQMRCFQYARSAAELSNFRQRVGAVAVFGKQILNTGHSSTRSHPIQARYDAIRNFRPGIEPKHSLHAEIACLAPLLSDPNIDWSRVELYVYRIRKDRPHGMARPCVACMGMLKELSKRGFKHLYYTTDDGYAYERIF